MKENSRSGGGNGDFGQELEDLITHVVVKDQAGKSSSTGSMIPQSPRQYATTTLLEYSELVFDHIRTG